MNHVETGYPSYDKTHLKNVPFYKQKPFVLPYNLFDLFLFFNKKHMDEPAVECEDRTHTKSDLKQEVLVIAKGLTAIGLKSGDSVGIAISNIYEGVVLTFSANLLGIKVFYLDEQILPKELERVKIDCLVVCDKTEEEIISLRVSNTWSMMSLMRVILIEKHPEKHLSISSSCEVMNKNSIYTYWNLIYLGIKPNTSITIARLANKFNSKNLLFPQTSGSTAELPKILQFTNRSFSAFLSTVQVSTDAKPCEEAVERVLIIIPYRISYGWTLTFANICIGNCVRFAKSASPEAIGEYYRYKPTYIYGTPLIFQCFMNKTPKDVDLSFLKKFYVAGFSVSEDVLNAGRIFLDSHNSKCEICNNYGIGEALCIGTTSDGIAHKPGSSGKFYLGADWILVDENNREVKYDEVGEILVSSDTLSDGYYKDPSATTETFINFRGRTYLRTGDYATIDREGYVKILGRKKRFYQPLGARDKVNCETIEKTLSKCELVRENAVAIYSPEGKYEISVAFVVLRPNIKRNESTRERIFSFLKEKLQEFQLPSRIVFMDKLPRLSSTKYDYNKLTEMCSSNYTKPL